MNMQQREALAEKQPRLKKEHSMLYTDKQLCLVSYKTQSSAMRSISDAEIRMVAFNSLRVACFTSHHREAAPECDSAGAAWQCIQ